MPQTRFVLSKAFECGLRPLVVINKIDRPDARPHEVLDETLELFLSLGADDVLADFPYLFASAKLGFVTDDPDRPTDSISAADGHDPGKGPRAGRGVGRPLADAGHHAGLVRLRRANRHWASPVGDHPQGPERRADADRGTHYAGQGGRRLRLRGPRPAGGPRGRCGRHLRGRRARRRRNRRHGRGAPVAPRPAAAESGRAHAENDLRRQHLAPGRPRRRQVPYQPPPPRAAAARDREERRPARRADRRHRAVRRCRPRRTAPLDPHRDHAPRGLRNLGRQAARDFQRDRRPTARAVRVAGGRNAGRPHRAGDGNDRPAARPVGRDVQPQRLRVHGLLDPGPRLDRHPHPAA